MKKRLSFIILLVLIIANVLSCTAKPEDSADTGTVAPMPDEPIKTDITIHLSALDMSVEYSDFIKGLSNDRYNVLTSWDNCIKFTPWATDKNSIDFTNSGRPHSYIFEGKYLSLVYECSKNNQLANSADPDLKRYGKTLTYTSGQCDMGDPDYYCNFRDSDNVLIYYSDKKHTDPVGSQTLSQEEAVSTATEWIASYYKESASAYTFKKSEVLSSGRISVTFTRIIHGFETDDKLTVHCSPSGRIVYVWAQSINMYDKAAESVTKEDVNNTLDVLRDIFPKDRYTVSTQNALIRMDRDGQLYLTLQVSDISDSEWVKQITVELG